MYSALRTTACIQRGSTVFIVNFVQSPHDALVNYITIPEAYSKPSQTSTGAFCENSFAKCFIIDISQASEYVSLHGLHRDLQNLFFLAL